MTQTNPNSKYQQQKQEKLIVKSNNMHVCAHNVTSQEANRN